MPSAHAQAKTGGQKLGELEKNPPIEDKAIDKTDPAQADAVEPEEPPKPEPFPGWNKLKARFEHLGKVQATLKKELEEKAAKIPSSKSLIDTLKEKLTSTFSLGRSKTDTAEPATKDSLARAMIAAEAKAEGLSEEETERLENDKTVEKKGSAIARDLGKLSGHVKGVLKGIFDKGSVEMQRLKKGEKGEKQQ